MKDNNSLDRVLERFYNRYNKYNSKVLKFLGEKIKQFENLTPNEAHKLSQTLKYNTEIDQLMNELSKISGKSIKELDELLDEVAKENVGFAEVYYEYRNKDFIPYEENDRLKRYVKTVKKETKGTFTNLSKAKNVGFTLKDEQGNITFQSLRNTYRKVIDEAVFNVTTGVEDYQSAMRNTIKQLADSGVKIHEEKVGYKSGYNRRIDSTVRQNILTGMRSINIGIQEMIGEELGADGVEISAHSPCAEDHLPYQGQQYTEKEFNKINSNLERPIGDRGYNCGHFIFSIIMGVNEPSYTKKQLRKLNAESTRKFKYEGKTYTSYQASQVQRQLETNIRRQKDRQIIARASGDKGEIADAQDKISKLTSKYNDFSAKAGLDTYKNRLTVTGYRKVSTK